MFTKTNAKAAALTTIVVTATPVVSSVRGVRSLTSKTIAKVGETYRTAAEQIEADAQAKAQARQQETLETERKAFFAHILRSMERCSDCGPLASCGKGTDACQSHSVVVIEAGLTDLYEALVTVTD